MSQLNDVTLIGPENGKHKVMILIDLQKAFDTLDHEILLSKIKYTGFSNKAIQWFHSYLINEAFFVSLGTVLSEEETKNWISPRIYIGTFVVFDIT